MTAPAGAGVSIPGDVQDASESWNVSLICALMTSHQALMSDSDLLLYSSRSKCGTTQCSILKDKRSRSSHSNMDHHETRRSLKTTGNKAALLETLALTLSDFDKGVVAHAKFGAILERLQLLLEEELEHGEC